MPHRSHRRSALEVEYAEQAEYAEHDSAGSHEDQTHAVPSDIDRFAFSPLVKPLGSVFCDELFARVAVQAAPRQRPRERPAERKHEQPSCERETVRGTHQNSLFETGTVGKGQADLRDAGRHRQELVQGVAVQ